MPAYELFLLIRNMPRPELVQSIKRSAESILSKNGVIRAFENMGQKELPYRIKAHGGYHTTGNYVLIKFDLPGRDVFKLSNEISKDADYLRTCVSSLVEPDEFQVDCKCEEKGAFVKNLFNYEKPMTHWDKKKVYKNYGRRI